MSAQPLAVMTAGGTGGHVYPALAVALELQKRGFRVAWVGTRIGLEHRVIPAAGIDIHYLPVRGVRGKSFFSKIGAAVLLLISIFRAILLLRKLGPSCVVGMGGFAAGPAGIAAWILRIPLLIHEQNAVAGTTNRLLAPFAKKVVAAFEGAFGKKRKVAVVGNPVRRELLEAGAVREYEYAGQRPLRILVLGGSLGAAPINDIIPGTVRRLERDRAGKFEVWHQTGEVHIEEMTERYGGIKKEPIALAPFIEDMEMAYKWADIVLCRSGALTVSELAIMGRPAILVPLPQAIDDHQKLNARILRKAGAAEVLLQTELDSYRLGDMFRNYMANPHELEAMSVAAYRVGTPHATQKICDFCEDLCNGR
jgi:UDP-N-acetylglucosamine--N-acetylmuramyl-(pentapeptide) pyrophosphoryl-undecaprenol N-acetylglucosamine transferase